MALTAVNLWLFTHWELHNTSHHGTVSIGYQSEVVIEPLPAVITGGASTPRSNESRGMGKNTITAMAEMYMWE